MSDLIIDHTGEPRTLNYMMKEETFFMRRKWVEMEEANSDLTDKLSDYQQDMAVLVGENEALVAAINEILYDLLESNSIMSVYWRKKTLHLRVKEGGKG